MHDGIGHMVHPPWMETPPHNPLDGDPPPLYGEPPWMETPAGQQAGGTHPTGMHSCSINIICFLAVYRQCFLCYKDKDKI